MIKQDFIQKPTTFSAYQQEARVFRKETANSFYAALGLGEEAGEVQGKIAKIIRDGFRDAEHMNMFKVELTKELGDVLWFIAAIADDNGINLQNIAETNLLKPGSRFDRGTISGSGDNR